MGKPTGFMEYERKDNAAVEPLERIKNFNEFHAPLCVKKNRKEQAARCMDCGVPFCQSGMMIGGMASGCPLNNLVPEWNDLVYTVATVRKLYQPPASRPTTSRNLHQAVSVRRLCESSLYLRFAWMTPVTAQRRMKMILSNMHIDMA